MEETLWRNVSPCVWIVLDKAEWNEPFVCVKCQTKGTNSGENNLCLKSNREGMYDRGEDSALQPIFFQDPEVSVPQSQLKLYIGHAQTPLR